MTHEEALKLTYPCWVRLAKQPLARALTVGKAYTAVRYVSPDGAGYWLRVIDDKNKETGWLPEHFTYIGQTLQEPVDTRPFYANDPNAGIF